jgi:hypothetical protein
MRDRNDQPQDGDMPGIYSWNPWQPFEAMKWLAGVQASWCIAGGWALDLWHGKQTRPHVDLEIAILRPHFPLFRSQLADFKCYVASDGKVSALAPGSIPEPGRHQIRILDEAIQSWRMDIFLEPGDSLTWAFRRDETIRRPRSQMIATTREGVPYLKPEGVLLYKAKAAHAKDEGDFRACAPLLQPSARAWLRDALSRAHPGHPWIGNLQ